MYLPGSQVLLGKHGSSLQSKLHRAWMSLYCCRLPAPLFSQAVFAAVAVLVFGSVLAVCGGKLSCICKIQ